METEYALVAGSCEGSRVRAAESLLALARRRLTHLPGAGSPGLFLENGGRFYTDVGAHPEFATAEVDTPEELVRYLAAGDAEIADLAGELRAAGRPEQAPMLLKSNICYANPGVTWASHESFLHAGGSDGMPRQLIPFLVSRVMHGSGGLNPLCPGIQLSLSPRVHLFTRTMGDSTTGNRPIYNGRNESLSSRGMSRLHVIVGDSTHSQLSQFIKVGSTALVVLLAELGLDPGGTMQLACPLIALHSFATDPYFRTTADRVTGPPVTALDVQSHYLQCVEQQLDRKAMPVWAREVCRRWRAALDLARHGPQAALGVFDWAVKKLLFDQHITRRGVKPETFAAWNHALTCARDAHRQLAGSWQFNEAILFSDHPAVVAERRNQDAHLKSHGLCWEQAPAFLKLRDELCEIDVRCAQIVPAGLFSELGPHLQHQLIDPQRVQEARREPPQGTRARFRGEQIRRCAGRKGCTAEWQRVYNEKGMYLDLADPLDDAPVWKPVPPEPQRRGPVSPVRQCAGLYDVGDYAAAYTKASQILIIFRGGEGLPDDERRLLLQVVARTRARCGEAEAALAMLDTLAAETSTPQMPLWLMIDYIGVMRKSSLAPGGRRFWELIEEAEQLLDRPATSSESRDEPAMQSLLLGHKGYALTRQGRAGEAVQTLRRACAGTAAVPDRIRARTLADLADAFRMLGDTEAVVEPLRQAERYQVALNYFIDRADHSLTARAKLTPDRKEAYRLLRGAQRTLDRGGAKVALARNLLLQARLCGRSCRRLLLHEQVTALLDNTPSLWQCPAVARVLSDWDAWVHEGPEPATIDGKGDAFWCL